jgi:hypothetical protein
MKKLVTYSAGAKNCARQIVHEAFNDILSEKFIIPSQKKMENILKDFIDYDFDEYQKNKKVKAKNPSWEDEQVNDEVYKLKMRHDKEYQGNLRQAASQAISEIENLLRSFNDAIKAWKIKNLE